jgi:twitching motility protein PilT
MNEHSRFRCNYLKQNARLWCGLPAIPTKIMSLDQLGIPPVVKEFGHTRGGLVLVLGPRVPANRRRSRPCWITSMQTSPAHHHGRRTDRICARNKRSIITQREVPEHSTSFPAGLKAALREDADIVLVGEMRDLETIQLALTAAETGLLVFGTLHTNNARKTVDRMIDVFPSDQQAQVRTMLANSLRESLRSSCSSGRTVAAGSR